MNEAFNKFGKNQQQLIALNIFQDGSTSKIDDYVKKYKVLYPSIAGNDGASKITKDYGINGWPSMKLVKSNKSVVSISPFKNIIQQVEKHLDPTIVQHSQKTTNVLPNHISHVSISPHTITCTSQKAQTISIGEYSLTGRTCAFEEKIFIGKGTNVISWPQQQKTKGVRIFHFLLANGAILSKQILIK